MIKFITRGHVDIELNGKVVTIEGEALFRTAEGSPDFVAYKSSIRNWSDGTPLTEAEIAAVLADLVESGRDQGMVIEVE